MVDMNSTVSRLTHTNTFVKNEPLSSPFKDKTKFTFSSDKTATPVNRAAQITASVPKRIFDERKEPLQQSGGRDFLSEKSIDSIKDSPRMSITQGGVSRTYGQKFNFGA
jgi:hypothetical protein